MQEPTTSKYPLQYDDDSSLFAAFINHTVYTVKYTVDVEMRFVVVNEDASALQTPAYITFEGGEIWLVDTVSTNAVGEWVLEVESHADQRALHGSPLQPHVVDEKIYVGLLSQPVIMLKRAVRAAQKYRFLITDEAGRATMTPQVGERVLCTDSLKIYYCIEDGIWSWAGRTRHSDLDNLDSDDHPQYAATSDVVAWHDSAGYHMMGGDDHDHTDALEGFPVRAIRSSIIADIGDPVTEVDVCFVTDMGGGSLYVSFDGVSFEPLLSIPSGAIAMFDSACPPGWSAYAAMDGRFPRGAETVGAAGGADTHSHAYTAVHAHTHDVTSKTVTLASAGGHTHGVVLRKTTGGSSSGLAMYGGNDTYGANAGGDHTHLVTIPTGSTQSAGTSAATGSASSVPPYQEMVFCKKD